MLDKTTLITAILAGSFAMATPALAVTVQNKSDKEHEITFDHGTDEVRKKVAAGDSVEEKCPNVCGVRVDSDGTGYEAQGDDTLVVKGGELHWASQLDADEGG